MWYIHWSGQCCYIRICKMQILPHATSCRHTCAQCSDSPGIVCSWLYRDCCLNYNMADPLHRSRKPIGERLYSSLHKYHPGHPGCRRAKGRRQTGSSNSCQSVTRRNTVQLEKLCTLGPQPHQTPSRSSCRFLGSYNSEECYMPPPKHLKLAHMLATSLVMHTHVIMNC